jgi:hypothetical protein
MEFLYCIIECLSCFLDICRTNEELEEKEKEYKNLQLIN